MNSFADGAHVFWLQINLSHVKNNVEGIVKFVKGHFPDCFTICNVSAPNLRRPQWSWGADRSGTVGGQSRRCLPTYLAHGSWGRPCCAAILTAGIVVRYCPADFRCGQYLHPTRTASRSAGHRLRLTSCDQGFPDCCFIAVR